MQQVAESWLVYHLTNNPVWLGIVAGASALPYVSLSLYGGQLADRHPRRNILLITNAAAMVLAFLLAFLAWNGSPIPIKAWHIALMAAILGAVRAFMMPAQQAFVIDIVEDRRAIPGALALNSLRFNLARFAGPVIAGIILTRSGAAACFFWNGISFVAVILSLSWMKMPHFKPGLRHLSIGEGISYILRERSVLQIVMIVAIGSLLLWPVSTLFPVFAHIYGVGKLGFSMMVAINGAGAAAAGVLLTGLSGRISRRRLVFTGAYGFGFSLLLFTVTPEYHYALLCLFLVGFCMILFGINANTYVQECVPDAIRGRVMAVYTLVFGGLMPFGGLLLGFTAKHIGAILAVQINAAIGLLLFTLSGLSEIRRKLVTHQHTVS